MLTRQDLAKRYNVSTRTIDRWIGKGLPVKKSAINGRVYIDEGELEKWEKKMLITGKID